MTEVIVVTENGMPTVYSNKANVNIEFIDLDRIEVDPDNYEEESERYEQILSDSTYKRIY